MKSRLVILLCVLFCSAEPSYSQAVKQDTVFYKHYIGTSVWMIANLLPEPPDFYQLDYGHRFTNKDVWMIRAITWTYKAPLGIPYGSSLESPEEKYPGYVRAFGVGMGYQRFLWKELFSAIHATPFLQNFYNADNKKIQKGFQLFMQAQVGYRIKLFRNRCYLETSLFYNYWPVNTNFPESFLQKENKWPNYFLFEPHFNIGINF